MNSEKAKEIKKALEYCSNHSVSDCSNVCPYDKYKTCRTELTKDSLTLINELESENERLNKSDTSKEESFIEYYNLYRDFKRENQQLKDRIAELECSLSKKTMEYELLKCGKKIGDGIVEVIDEAKKSLATYEALKQFAERLKKRLNLGLYKWQYAEVDSKTIDEVLKEYIDEE